MIKFFEYFSETNTSIYHTPLSTTVNSEAFGSTNEIESEDEAGKNIIVKENIETGSADCIKPLAFVGKLFNNLNKKEKLNLNKEKKLK